MGDDPTEHVQEEIHHHATHGHDEHGHKSAGWITAAALTAAFLAAFAAVSSSLATKHLTESTLTRIRANDTWNEYQSKSIKKYIIDSRTLAVSLADPTKISDPAAIAKQQKSDKGKLAEYATPIEEDSAEDPKGTLGLGAKATKLEEESKAELTTHETYETSATMFHIAIAIVAIAVVAKRKEFWYVSMVGGVVGIYFFGMALTHAPVEAPHHEAEVAPSTEHAVPAGEHAAKPAETAAVPPK